METKTFDARGMACPLPVVNAKKESEEMTNGGTLIILVDNEIAFQNRTVQRNHDLFTGIFCVDMRHIMLSTLFAVHSDNDAVKNAQYRQLHHFPSQCHFNIQQSGFQGASTAFLSCLQAFKIDSEYHGVQCPTAE